MKFHDALAPVFLVLLFILIQVNDKPVYVGLDCHFCKQYPFLTWCGGMIVNGYLTLLLWNHTYRRILLWFISFAKRNGLDKVMRPRVFMFVTALMTLSVIQIQSIGILVYLSWWLICFICLVVMRTFGNDTSGFTEGVCIGFFASGAVYAWQNAPFHALVCLYVSAFAFSAKRILEEKIHIF
ncbi:hypothetical protein MKX03_022441 [Papaver bracteatum]|nr:hypothetical protein MKX03_022441 [Papaver bracteatum]